MDSGNAIAWGHLQLRGGWRNILIAGGTYLAIIVVLIFVFLRLDPFSTASTLNGWVTALMVFQIAILLIYGSYTIAGAIRKDVSSKLIESHRLMPISGTEAVIGYILGPGAQAITMAAVNVLVGLAIAPAAGISIIAWLKANMVLGIFVTCYWVVVIFLTLAMPFGSRVLMGLVWVLAMAHQGVAPLVPGLSFLVGPALGVSVFGIIATNQLTSIFQYSILAQMLFALLCFIGAVRKYRRDDVLSWGPIVGLVVLVAYVGISLIGLSLWEGMRPRMFRTERLPFEVQLTIAAIGAMWVAALPVCAITWMHAEYRRRRALNDPAPNPKPPAIMLVTLAAALISALILPLAVRVRWSVCMQPVSVLGGVVLPEPAVGQAIPVGNLIRTGLIFVAFLVTIGYLFRIVYGWGKRSAWGAVILLIVVAWIGPVVADFILGMALRGGDPDDVLSSLSTASPPAALFCLWAGGPVEETTVGIAFQCVVAGLLAALYHSTRPRAQIIPFAVPVSR